MRKLVTIRKISAIDPIEGADSIDVATLDGWKVVVKKGEFKIGIEARDGMVFVVFPQAVSSFGIPPEFAKKVGELIIQKSHEAENEKLGRKGNEKAVS